MEFPFLYLLAACSSGSLPVDWIKIAWCLCGMTQVHGPMGFAGDIDHNNNNNLSFCSSPLSARCPFETGDRSSCGHVWTKTWCCCLALAI
jgi:hypothetical protein